MVVGDEVTLDGKPVNWSEHNGPGRKATATDHVYIKYWKPRGIICTTDRTIKGNVISEVCTCWASLNSIHARCRHGQQHSHVLTSEHWQP